MKSHPMAEIFPMMGMDELKAMANDILANGLREKITTFEGMVLDGRNRLAACELANVPLGSHEYEEYTGKDPLAFVLSKNLKRRHLTESQRAMVAVKIANLSEGQNKLKVPQKREENTDAAPIGAASNPTVPTVSQADAAKKMNVGKRTVQRAKKVKDSGDKKLVEEVERGEKTVNAAVKEVEAKAQEPIPATVPIDDFDLPIPEPLRELFAFAEEKFGEANTLIRKLEAAIDEIAKHGAGQFFKRNLQPNHANGKDSFKFTPLRDLKAWLKMERPIMAICPYCHSTKPKGKPDPRCGGCNGAGWATKSVLDACPVDYIEAAKLHLNGGDE